MSWDRPGEAVVCGKHDPPRDARSWTTIPTGASITSRRRQGAKNEESSVKNYRNRSSRGDFNSESRPTIKPLGAPASLRSARQIGLRKTPSEIMVPPIAMHA